MKKKSELNFLNKDKTFIYNIIKSTKNNNNKIINYEQLRTSNNSIENVSNNNNKNYYNIKKKLNLKIASSDLLNIKGLKKLIKINRNFPLSNSDTNSVSVSSLEQNSINNKFFKTINESQDVYKNSNEKILYVINGKKIKNNCTYHKILFSQNILSKKHH